MSRPPGFTLIAAVDDAGGIGRNGRLPWRLQADMEYFRRTTTGAGGGVNAVILGRRTWESLPARFRPLPERRNVVVSRQPGFVAAGAQVAASLEAALALARAGASTNAASANGEVFIIGGAEIYAAALRHQDCGRILLTRVAGEHGCDVFFPEFERLRLVAQGPTQTEGELQFAFCEYARPPMAP